MVLSNRREAELNGWIDRHSLSLAEKAVMKAATDEVVRHVQRDFEGKNVPDSAGKSLGTVNRIFLGGSMKKGTVLNIDNDVDLVVFVNCLFKNYEQNLLDLRGKISKRIADSIRALPGVEIIDADSFYAKLRYKNVYLDILPAFNAVITTANVVAEQRTRMRELVKDPSYTNKNAFSACFTESSCGFIEKRYEREILPRAIKLAKLWNKKVFALAGEGYTAKLRSYALELLLAHLYDRDKNASPPELFCRMLDVLSLKSESYDIMFNDYFPIQFQANTRKRPLRIYDPCCPENDVVDDFVQWASLKKAASRSLDVIVNGGALEDIFSPKILN